MKLAITAGLLLATLLISPALAQFELNPADEPATLPIPVGMGLLASEEYFHQRFPDEDAAPDFLLRYHPAAHALLGWDGMDGLGGYRAEEHLLDSAEGQPLLGEADERFDSLEIAVFGIAEGRLELYDHASGQPVLRQTVEFPPVSAEYVWLVDLTGDGRSEVVVSGMTGISNGGGAYVFRMLDDGRLEAISEGEEGEFWPQMLWSFYGSLELLRTADGHWVYRSISPVGRNLSDYFWSWFYEWDAASGRFVMDGPSYHAEKRQQYQFFQRFQQVLKDFLADPAAFSIDDPALGYSYGFSDDDGDYSLDCFTDEDGSILDWLLEETITELDYMLADPVDGSDRMQ
ncbi:MAG: hypothetical protein R3F46_10380 [bacterium]